MKHREKLGKRFQAGKDEETQTNTKQTSREEDVDVVWVICVEGGFPGFFGCSG